MHYEKEGVQYWRAKPGFRQPKGGDIFAWQYLTRFHLPLNLCGAILQYYDTTLLMNLTRKTVRQNDDRIL
jgi:hypothetical protein